MKKHFLPAVLSLLLYCSTATAQYKVSAQSNDAFSHALVRLLNEAPLKFAGCKGNFLQYSSMAESEHALDIVFPGSIAAIIRYRDLDANAYVEFGPYSNSAEMKKAIRLLKKQIAKALGNQLYENDNNDTALFFMMSLRDKEGYYQSNFELLTGSTGRDSYLLPGPEAANKRHHFILLKAEGRMPSYYNFITAADTVPADQPLQATLNTLLKAAATDFRYLKATDTFLSKRKRRDTVLINGHTVFINRNRSQYTTSISIPAAGDSAAFAGQWQHYRQVMKAVAGERYVYHETRYDLPTMDPFIVFFNKHYDNIAPTLYLQQENYTGQERQIVLKVESRVGHPQKRSANWSEWEE